LVFKLSYEASNLDAAQTLAESSGIGGVALIFGGGGGEEEESLCGFSAPEGTTEDQPPPHLRAWFEIPSKN
jgi:hypothetical protein